MKKRLYLVLDQGGSASRAIIFDQNGRQLYISKQEVGTCRRQSGHVEHDPNELVSSLHSAAAQVVSQLTQEQKSCLYACALITQRSTLVCWDKFSGAALSQAISWQDVRAEGWLQKQRINNDEIYRTTGLFPNAHFGLSKIHWCLDNIPAVKTAQEQRRLTIAPLASYLTYQLLEENPWLVDPANASRTLLTNVSNGDWDKTLLKKFKLCESLLPPIVPNKSDYGTFKVLDVEIAMGLLSGDQSAAVFSEATPDKACCYVNIGTGAFIYRVADKLEFEHRQLNSIAHVDEHICYVNEGTVNGAGAALEKYAAEYNITDIGEVLSVDWRSVNDETLPFFLNGVGGLASPYWRSDFESMFVNDEAASNKERLIAIAESILFLLYKNLTLFLLGGDEPKAIVISGGVSQSDVLCQYLADLTQLPVKRSEACEASARGAAFLLNNHYDDWAPLQQHIFMPGRHSLCLQRYQQWLLLMEKKL